MLRQILAGLSIAFETFGLPPPKLLVAWEISSERAQPHHIIWVSKHKCEECFLNNSNWM